MALSMLNVNAGWGHSSTNYMPPAMNALKTYGDLARWTRPVLNDYISIANINLADSDYNTIYPLMLDTITSIDDAITSPIGLINLLPLATPQVVVTTGAKAITLTGTSPRTAVTFTNVTLPAHGTLTGIPPNLTYTPTGGYTGPDYFTFQVVDNLTTSVPGTVSIIVGTAGTGLKGDYYDNADFTNLKLTRTDAQVNFDWGTGSPNVLMGADSFSVRWSGLLLVPETGTYTFSTLNSDGVKLYVNGVLVIDDFSDHTTHWKDGSSVNLTAGQMVDIRMDYYENKGSAVAKLKWTGPSFAGVNGAIIPQAYLFDASTVPNRPAFAYSQSLMTNKNTALPITLDGSGGSLTYTVLTQPANGTLSGTVPNLTYTPNSNYSGVDSFTFRVNNGTSNSAPATVSIGITTGPPVNFTWLNAASGNLGLAGNWTSGTAPVTAGSPTYTLNFSPSGTYTVTHNLNNGFQLNQLNVAGTVTITGTNSLAFTANGYLLPQLNQNSTNLVTVDSPIQLAAMTTFGGSRSGDVTLTKQITGSGGIIKSSIGRLLIYGAASNNFSGGTIVNTGTLALGYYDATNPLGTGPVTLNGGDIEMQRITASNTLTVNGGTLTSVNGFGAIWSGPVTLNQMLTARCNYALTLDGIVSGNAGIIKTSSGNLTLSVANSYTGTTEIREGTLTCSNVSALGTGSLILSTPGKATLNYTGTRSIASLTLGGTPMPAGTYGSTASNATNKNDVYFSGTGTVTVLASASAPVATAQSVTTAEETAKAITLTATDPNGNPLTYAIVSYPAHGTLSGTAPNLTYVPVLNYNGADSFTFKANDGTFDSTPATVTITVTAVNDAPYASAQSVIVRQGFAKAIALVGADAEGSAITYAIVSPPTNGTLSGTPPNVTYTASVGYFGPDSFSFKVNDGTSNSNIATVSITVNTPPVVNAGPDQTISLTYTAPTTVWSFAPWTGDSDSGISNTYTYTAAQSFGNNRSSATVNGVTFTEGTATSGTGWSVGGGGTVAFWDGDDDAAVTGDSEQLAQEFIYNGSPRTVTFTGLTAGQTYEASFFSAAWETGTRSQTFSTPGVTSAVINQDQYGNNMGIRITCVYTATSTSQVLTITPQVGGSFHLYAMANRIAPNRTVTVNLAGTASDTNNDPLTSAWTLVSGPAAVSFGSTTALNTTAMITMAGTYVFRLTANDGYDPASDDVTIIVNPESPYVAWSGSISFASDANGDGISNGLAWALGASGPSTSAASLLPTFDNINNPDYFIFTYRRSDAANSDPNTTISAQFGSDLNSWTTAVHDGTNIIITPADNFYGSSPGVDKVEVKIKRTLATTGKIFTRLKVNIGP